MGEIRVTEAIAILEGEVAFTFVRASGPGGQNVNKVSTAAQLRFDARRSPSLPPELAERLLRLAGARATSEGEIVITARTHRSAERNRSEALDRLVRLIARAAETPKPRRRTRVPRSAVRARLEGKARRGRAKALRAAPKPEME